MSYVPDDLRYTENGEWLRLVGDLATIGLTDHAQQALGAVIRVNFPGVGNIYLKGTPMGTIETKGVVDANVAFYAPIDGAVMDINIGLITLPQDLNTDSYGDGWLLTLKVNNPADVEKLMTAEQYTRFLAGKA